MVISRQQLQNLDSRAAQLERLRVGRLAVASCLSLWLAIASHAGSACGDVLQENSDIPAAHESADSEAPIAPDIAQKKNALWLAFIMWAGVIFGGVILLTLVVMWGNRTRRLARSPLPPVAKRDELWFLKPRPPAGNAHQPGPADSGSGDLGTDADSRA